MYPLLNAYNITERLMSAVQSIDYEEVLKCLMQGAQATLVSSTSGYTAVGLAALVGDAEILELLIQSCEEPELFQAETYVEMELDSTPEGMDDLEWEDEFELASKIEDVADAGSTLYFYYAKTFERTGEIVSGLKIENNGATYAAAGSVKKLPLDPHTRDAMVMSPIHYAAACGNVQCARILIQHDALIDVINADGFTPLHLGVKSPQIIKLLLESGANSNMKTFCRGMTPLHYAISKNMTTANILLEHATTDVNAVDHIDQTPLMMAVFHNKTEIATKLISLGAHVNVHDTDGNSALKYAVLQNNLTLAKLLLDLGTRRLPSHHLLHHCVNYNYRDMAELLIKNGESLNLRNKLGHTPITSAIIGIRTELLEYFLTVQAKEYEGELKSNYILQQSKNDLQVAVQFLRGIREFKAIARILFARSVSATSWITSSDSIDTTTTCTLVTSCQNVAYCKTPLAFAIITHKYEIAEFLIHEGIDTSCICRDHVANALRLLRAPGYAELAKLLVHAGFKFPLYKAPFPYYWTAERVRFEKEMNEFCGEPLVLQSLARLCIRKHLVKILKESIIARKQYCATLEQSSLSRMIQALGVPHILQTYLSDFSDCCPVSNKFSNVFYPPITNIFELQLEI